MKPTFNENKPRFQTIENKRNTRDKNSRPKEESTHKARKLTLNRAETIYPTEAKKASGQGSVKIQVKGSSNLQKEKKTGPLSPRAPEKIKKNRAEEMKVYGENSCLAVFQQRPESIVRLWATVEGAKKLGDMLSYLAEHKKAYHVVSREEMEKVTGTEHHGDVCLLVKKLPVFSLEGFTNCSCA